MPSESASERKHVIPRVIAAATVISLLAFGGWYVDRKRSEKRSTLSGVLESQPTVVSSRAPGRVAAILVQEGASLSAGQPLVRLEAATPASDARAKRAQAGQAEAAYRDALAGPSREDIARQSAVVAEMRAGLRKLQNGSRPEEIAGAQAKFAAADAAYRKAVDGTRPQDIAAARAAALAARAHLAAVLRGPTPEERAQARARLAAGEAQRKLAVQDADRYQNLYQREAVTRQQLDQKIAARDEAIAREQELRDALRQTEIGTPQAEREEARQMLRQAQARLSLAVAGSRPEDIASARATRDAALADLQLVRDGARQEDIAAAKARLAEAQAALASLRAGTRPEQISAARSAWVAAKAAADAAQTTATEAVVRAPVAGRADRVLVAAGDLLQAGTPIVSETRPGDLFLRVYVPEEQLAHVAVGDRATVAVDGIGTPVTFVVEAVSSQGEFTPANLQSPEERGRQVFAVRLKPEHAVPALKAGLFVVVKSLGGNHE